MNDQQKKCGQGVTIKSTNISDKKKKSENKTNKKRTKGAKMLAWYTTFICCARKMVLRLEEVIDI